MRELYADEFRTNLLRVLNTNNHGPIRMPVEAYQRIIMGDDSPGNSCMLREAENAGEENTQKSKGLECRMSHGPILALSHLRSKFSPLFRENGLSSVPTFRDD